MLSYNVTVSVNPENAGVVNGAGTYNHGEDVTLTATANEGYKFVNWTENGEVVSEEAKYLFEITKDRNLVANFEEIEDPENPGGNEPGVGDDNEDPENPGGNEPGEGDDNEDPENPGGNDPEQPENPEQPGDSVVLAAPLVVADTVTETTVTLLWNVVENATSYNVYMDTELVENVTDTVYMVDGLTAETAYSFTVTAVADTLESEFSNVVTVTTLKIEEPGGDEPIDPEQPVDPENPGGNEPGGGDDETICVITAVANPEEGGSVSGAGTYKKDMTVTLKATAKSGYQFLNWTENDVIVSTESEYTFTITKDINLVANFEKTTCNVTVVVNPEEAGTVTGAGTYIKNMSVTLVATANTGYKFVNWTENGTIVSTEREYSFVVSLDTDLVANFISTEGVEELTSSFNIYPNPVSDKLYIETQTQTQTVEIYDVYGRRQSMVNGQQSTVIDVSDLNSGVYFVKVVTNEGDVVKRFVKK